MIGVEELVKFRSQLNTDSIEEETAAIIGYIYGKGLNTITDSDEAHENFVDGYINGWIAGIKHESCRYAKNVKQCEELSAMLTNHLKPIEPVEPDVTIPKQ